MSLFSKMDFKQDSDFSLSVPVELRKAHLLNTLATELEKDASQYDGYEDAEDYDARADLVITSIRVNRPYEFIEQNSLAKVREAHQFPVYFMNREDGLKQISENFLNVRDEHTWIYVPSLELWIDDTTFAAEGSVRGDFLIRTYFMMKYPETQLFHTHPTPLYIEDMNSENLSERYLRLAAIPTEHDLFALLSIMYSLEAHTNVAGHVISQFGVTKYTKFPADVHLYAERRRIPEEIIFDIAQQDSDSLDCIKKALSEFSKSFDYKNPGELDWVPLWNIYLE